MYKQLKNLGLVVISLLLLFQNINSQCIVHEVEALPVLTGSSFPERVGQTFLTCEDGEVASISITLYRTGEFNLFVGVSTGSYLPTLYQNFTVAIEGIQKINLVTPFIVETGITYEFQLQRTSGDVTFPLNIPSDYPDGVLNLEGFYQNGADLDFEIEIVPTSICEPLLIFDNMDISAGNYKSGDLIISNGTVQAGTEVVFDSKNSICLNEGFNTQTTCVFTATIGGCQIDN